MPCTFFSRFTAGSGQVLARGVHATESILSSDRQQIAVGLSVQAITLLSRPGDASDRTTKVMNSRSVISSQIANKITSVPIPYLCVPKAQTRT